MNEKNLAKVKSYLHPDAKLISPMAGDDLIPDNARH
jgi:hypothetical protein